MMVNLRPGRGQTAQGHRLGNNRCDSKGFTLKPPLNLGESAWVSPKGFLHPVAGV